MKWWRRDHMPKTFDIISQLSILPNQINQRLIMARNQKNKKLENSKNKKIRAQQYAINVFKLKNQS